jgi:hypothetical protein
VGLPSPSSPGVEPRDSGRTEGATGPLVLSRRQLLGTGGVAILGALGSRFAPTQPWRATEAATVGWFDNAEVSLVWDIVSTPPYRASGSVAGKPLQLELLPTLTAKGTKIYTVTGKYAESQLHCEVKFGPDDDSFSARGAVGTDAVSLTCLPQAAGARKWPVTGMIAGQRLHLTLSASQSQPLSASIGTTEVKLGLTDVHSGPDAGETGGAKGMATFTVLGNVKAPGRGGDTRIDLVFVLQGHSGSKPPTITVRGNVCGPSTAIIVGLGFAFCSGLQD